MANNHLQKYFKPTDWKVYIHIEIAPKHFRKFFFNRKIPPPVISYRKHMLCVSNEQCQVVLHTLTWWQYMSLVCANNEHLVSSHTLMYQEGNNEAIVTVVPAHGGCDGEHCRFIPSNPLWPMSTRPDWRGKIEGGVRMLQIACDCRDYETRQTKLN
jgi:hypothetical protein